MNNPGNKQFITKLGKHTLRTLIITYDDAFNDFQLSPLHQCSSGSWPLIVSHYYEVEDEVINSHTHQHIVSASNISHSKKVKVNTKMLCKKDTHKGNECYKFK